MYLSLVRFLSLNVNNIVSPLDVESLGRNQKEFKYEKYVLFHLPLKKQPYSKIDEAWIVSIVVFFSVLAHILLIAPSKKLGRGWQNWTQIISWLAVSLAKKAFTKKYRKIHDCPFVHQKKILKYMTLWWLKDSQDPKLGNVSIPVQPCHGSCGSACEQEGENGWTFASVVQSIRE